MKKRYTGYENAPVAIASSILKHYGAPYRHETMPEVDSALADDPRNVILLLYDGLGKTLLEEHAPADGVLRRGVVRYASTVFPPTTVAATRSIQSGMTPIEHGGLGWTLYFEEAGDAVVTFMNIGSDGKRIEGPLLSETILPYTELTDQVHAAAVDVGTCLIAPFSGNLRVSTAESLIANAARITQGSGRHFIYGYWTEPDEAAHIYGVHSRQVKAETDRLGYLTEKLRMTAEDALIIITADHSLIDTKWLYLEDHPSICDMLARVPSIESRCVSLFVKDGMEDSFREAFEREFGGHFALMTHEEVIAERLFGDGVPHPRAEGFIGTFVAISLDEYCLAARRKEKQMIGAHAGGTEDEAVVPVIIMRTKEKRGVTA